MMFQDESLGSWIVTVPALLVLCKREVLRAPRLQKRTAHLKAMGQIIDYSTSSIVIVVMFTIIVLIFVVKFWVRADIHP